MQNQASQLTSTHLEHRIHTVADLHPSLQSSDGKPKEDPRPADPPKKKLVPHPSIELNLLGLDEAASAKTDRAAEQPPKKHLLSRMDTHSKNSSAVPKQPSSRALLTTHRGFLPLKTAAPATESLTARMAATSEHSKFFGDLEDNPENLIKFRNSQTHTDRPTLSKGFKDGLERVEKVLNQPSLTGRSASQKKTLQHQSAKLLDQPKSTEHIKALKASLQHQNKQQMQALDKKCLDLAKELNHTKERVGFKEKLFGQLGEQVQRLEAEVAGLELKKSGETANQLREKLQRIEESLRCEKQTEKRMARIIDICTISKSQNEDWLRKLAFFSANLQKCIREQEQHIKDMKRAAVKQDRKLLDLEIHSKAEKDRRENIMTDIQETLDNDKLIKMHLASTDTIIRDSVIEKRREIQEKLEERIRNDDHHKKEEEVLRKNIEIQQELDKLKKDYSKYSQLLEKGAHGEEWDQKPQFLKLLANYQKSKAMEADLLQKTFFLKETAKKNSQLDKKLKQLEQARQLLIQLETDPEYLENQEKKLLQTIETEKQRVAGLHRRSQQPQRPSSPCPRYPWKTTSSSQASTPDSTAETPEETPETSCKTRLDSDTYPSLTQLELELRRAKQLLSDIISPEDRATLQKGDERLFHRLLFENLRRGKSRGYKLTAVRSPRESLEDRSPAIEENNQSPAGG